MKFGEDDREDNKEDDRESNKEDHRGYIREGED
jgi:hypothetical protein